jgi:Flp pilus assembly protein TadG
MLVVLIAVIGIVVDVGMAFRAQRQLQAAADAAALAGAQKLPDPTAAAATARSYGTGTGGSNQISGVAVTEGVSTACLTSIPGCRPVNTVSVTENATIGTYFAKIVGFNAFNVKVKATACSPCGSRPVDIVLVLDRTGSMCQNSAGQSDPSCTDLNNAKAGIRTFLSFFDPKQARVGLSVLPPATSVSAKCTQPQNSNYNSTTAAYLLVPLSNDFRNTDGTLNTSSNLVSTLNCLQGNGTTSYANAIDAAQAELAAHGRTGVPHYIVFFSDGAANTGPSYYSSTSPYRAQPCHQGITSSNAAKANGTVVYSIGYALDDDTGGCKNANGSVESPSITVYQALQGIASSSDKFFNKPSPGELQTIYTTIAEDIAAGSSSLIG